MNIIFNYLIFTFLIFGSLSIIYLQLKTIKLI